MRYLIALGICDPDRRDGVAVSAPLHAAAPAAGGQGGPSRRARARLIYFAILVTIGLSFTISTMLWVFGK